VTWQNKSFAVVNSLPLRVRVGVSISGGIHLHKSTVRHSRSVGGTFSDSRTRSHS